MELEHSCQHPPVHSLAFRAVPERQRSERAALPEQDGLGWELAHGTGIAGRLLIGSDAETSAVAAVEGQVVAVGEAVFRDFERKN